MSSPDPLTPLADAHAAVAARLDDLSPEALAWRPGPDAWSPTDVLEHLVRTERGMVLVLSRQIAAGDGRRDVGTPSPEALDALSTFLRSDRQIPMPPGAARFVAPTGEPFADLRAEWDALLGLWRDAFGALPDGWDEVGLVKHPVAGALTAAGSARFAADHAHHHTAQLDRIRGADGFPHA